MNFRTLDLNLLRVFDAVMAEGSLTRAAAVLAMTQPAVSHAVKRLHGAVGEALFVRSAFGMKPTPKADALWPQVRSALALLQHSLAPSKFNPQDEARSFRLTMVDATAAMLTPGLVAAIERQRALVNLQVLPLTTRDPRAQLEQGQVDLALGHFPEAVTAIVAQVDETALRHARLYDTTYVCAMRCEHPLAQEPLTVDTFCAAQHLLVSLSGRPHGLVDQALASLGRRRRIVLTVNQFFTAGRLATQTDLLTVLPSTFVGAAGYGDRLVTRELPFDLRRVEVEMLWHARRDADPAHRWLRALVLAAANPAGADTVPGTAPADG